MASWQITKVGKIPELHNPILIEGLPGIGNVGKVAVDFIMDELHAKKIYHFFSYSFPHSVFVNEHNLVELPSIGLYYAKHRGNDLLFLAGDVQPVDEQGSYEFSEKVLDLSQEFSLHEVITLGGIGLPQVPKNPKVYCTGNSKAMMKRYAAGIDVHQNLYGVVGPIVGVSGLLIGLAKRKKIEGIAFLAETYGHPMYLGIKGAREIVKILNTKLKLKLDIMKLDKEVKEIEGELLKSEQFGMLSKKSALKKIKGMPGDVEYIG